MDRMVYMYEVRDDKTGGEREMRKSGNTVLQIKV